MYSSEFISNIILKGLMFYLEHEHDRFFDVLNRDDFTPFELSLIEKGWSNCSSSLSNYLSEVSKSL